MARGGFYKGEKKKQKKDKEGGSSTVFNRPVFTLPDLISKKKKQE